MHSETEKLVGSQIKKLRKKRNLSLRSLAEESGLSANAISLIERGHNSATISSLEAIAKALGVSVQDLFHTEHQDSIFHLKNGQGLKKLFPDFELHCLGFGMDHRQIDPYFITVFPDDNSLMDLISHPGQEFVYCLSGEIQIFVSDKQFRLMSGDSILFDALHPHGWLNSTKRNANLLIIFQSFSSPTSARLSHMLDE